VLIAIDDFGYRFSSAEGYRADLPWDKIKIGQELRAGMCSWNFEAGRNHWFAPSFQSSPQPQHAGHCRGCRVLQPRGLHILTRAAARVRATTYSRPLSGPALAGLAANLRCSQFAADQHGAKTSSDISLPTISASHRLPLNRPATTKAGQAPE